QPNSRRGREPAPRRLAQAHRQPGAAAWRARPGVAALGGAPVRFGGLRPEYLGSSLRPETPSLAYADRKGGQRFAARGLQDQQIAEQLFVSVRTVHATSRSRVVRSS